MKAPRCAATMIGSMPHTDPVEAVRLSLKTLPEVPVWPELPRRSFHEDMVHAHTQDLPCLVEDEAARKCFIDTRADCSKELAAFYEKALPAEKSGDLSAFALKPKYASALDAMVRALEDSGSKPFVKVQCIGPVSFALQLTDHEGRPLYYDETFQDVLSRQIALHGRWLARRFAGLADEVIAFLDEPALAAFGSSGYLGVSREDVIDRLGTALTAVKGECAAVGVHVCGNTDWSMIMEAGADVLNYDAYEYGPSMQVYAGELAAHLEAGGVLAWGIVPNSERIREETPASLEARFFGLVRSLVERGVDEQLLLDRSMLTPACGLGPLELEVANQVSSVLAGLASRVQAKVR